MPKPVTHLILYSAEAEKTDTYTVQYEEYWCGLSKQFVKDEPLTDEEIARDVRLKHKMKLNPPAPCKTCEKMFMKSRGEFE